MLQYNDIATLVAANLTPAQIASQLQPSGITNKQIPLSELRWYLRDQGLLYRGIDSPFIGPFAELVRSEQTPSLLKNGLIDFITHVFGTDNYLNTTDPVIAGQGVAMLSGLISAGMMSEAQRDGFYSLGGGQKYVDITESDITTCITQYNLEARYTAALSAGRAAINDGATDWPTVRDAIVVAGDDWGA